MQTDLCHIITVDFFIVKFRSGRSANIPEYSISMTEIEGEMRHALTILILMLGDLEVRCQLQQRNLHSSMLGTKRELDYLYNYSASHSDSYNGNTVNSHLSVEPPQLVAHPGADPIKIHCRPRLPCIRRRFLRQMLSHRLCCHDAWTG